MAEAPTHMPRQTPLQSKDAPTKASDVPVEPTALPDESTALPAVPAPEEEAATSDEAASQHSPKPVTDATELVEAVGGVIPAENREQLAQEGEQSSTASWQPSEAAAVVDALVSTQAKDEGEAPV